MKPQPLMIPGSYFAIGVDFRWDRQPAHALDIPAEWAQKWDGDFPFTQADALNREQALASVALHNRKATTKAKNGYPETWWLVFEVGEIGANSFLTLEKGAAASMNIEAAFTLVKPTAAEIAQHAAAAKGRKAVRNV
jgi:hypothetical protein